MDYPSKLIETAVEEVSKLPGIGRKTALRLVLHMLKKDEVYTRALAESLTSLRDNVQYCKTCHNISDSEICNICSSPRRDASQICVVEDIMDVMAIENTSQYFGLYHVLGGIINPIEGIGPEDINIQTLIERAKKDETKEVILALKVTMEGDTTAFYITKKLKECDVKVSSIARGIPVGGELEFADEITLGRSILSRTNYSIED
jgi:recombination protein RecR